MEDKRDWMKAVERTWVARFPKQTLATFGTTNLSYFVVTEPAYRDMQPEKREGVVRKGKVVAQKPAIVTPQYALNLQGFSPDAYDYMRHLASQYGANSPGILYQYKNEAERMDILSGEAGDIARRIGDDLDERKEDLSVVIVGVDELWDVALLKFIYEFTSSSMSNNVREFQSRGMLDAQPAFGGVPKAAIMHIERLFREVEQGRDADDLKRELDRWGLFEFFEDRFLALFRKKG
ncbi:MAG: hypothetical protein FJ317_00770 [SAR202 cluster bacterium]|nr:hypothetical protein [SAR202 cluster bacterium]